MINKSVAYTIYGVSDVLLPCRCNHSCTPICLGTAVQCCPERLAEAFCCTCGQPMPTCKCREPFWLQMITGRLVWQHVVWYKLQVFRFKGLNFAAVHNFTNVHNLSPMFWVILLLTNMVQHEFVPTSCDILRHLATSCDILHLWHASQGEAEVVPEHNLDAHSQHRWCFVCVQTISYSKMF